MCKILGVSHRPLRYKRICTDFLANFRFSSPKILRGGVPQVRILAWPVGHEPRCCLTEPQCIELLPNGWRILRCLLKEMAYVPHWLVFMWWDSNDVWHCRLLPPDRTERWIAATSGIARLLSQGGCRGFRGRKSLSGVQGRSPGGDLWSNNLQLLYAVLLPRVCPSSPLLPPPKKKLRICVDSMTQHGRGRVGTCHTAVPTRGYATVPVTYTAK